MFYFLVDFLRIQTQEGVSQIALRDCSKEVREEAGYIEVFFFFLQQKPGSQNIKILLLIKKTHLKLMNLVISMYRKMKESGFIDSFLLK